MDASNDSDARFFRLVEGERPREAFVLFLEAVEDKAWPDLAASDLRALDVVCQRLMPELLERHTLWMVSRPGRLRQMLQLLTRALEVNYRPPATLDQIAWLRCLLAISEAMVGRPERVHEELCLTRPEASAESGPPLNGTFRRQIQDLEPSEGAAAAFLQPFFEAYVGFLRRTGRHELANHVESRVLKLVGLIARDESRPGVVQALLFVQGGRGHARFIHVSLERRPPTEEERTSEETIIYARREVDRIDAVMQESAAWARVAADAYLKRAGYPDGLREQVVYWEIGTLRGDAADLPQQYEGGSAAMPLAVAIVSEYLDQPVPNDIAMTGAFTAVGTEEGHVRPVDGLPEKIQHALHSGSRVVYVPSGNVAELDGRPALKDLVAEHDARVVPVETVDEVCQELFPPEGSGRLQDALKDAGRNVLEMVGLAGPREGTPPPVPVHRHHRVFTLGCGLLVAASVFLEGWMVHKGFAPAYPSAEAWTRIGAASVIVLAGMWACFALPAACMRHSTTSTRRILRPPLPRGKGEGRGRGRGVRGSLRREHA